jgi:hypothetical protein
MSFLCVQKIINDLLSVYCSCLLCCYLAQVHDGGGEVVGPAVVALGAGVPGCPVPAHVTVSIAPA